MVRIGTPLASPATEFQAGQELLGPAGPGGLRQQRAQQARPLGAGRPGVGPGRGLLVRRRRAFARRGRLAQADVAPQAGAGRIGARQRGLLGTVIELEAGPGSRASGIRPRRGRPGHRLAHRRGILAHRRGYLNRLGSPPAGSGSGVRPWPDRAWPGGNPRPGRLAAAWWPAPPAAAGLRIRTRGRSRRRLPAARARAGTLRPPWAAGRWPGDRGTEHPAPRGRSRPAAAGAAGGSAGPGHRQRRGGWSGPWSPVPCRGEGRSRGAEKDGIAPVGPYAIPADRTGRARRVRGLRRTPLPLAGGRRRGVIQATRPPGSSGPVPDGAG